MELQRYISITDSKHETYEFLSAGPKGTIKKVVKYTEIEPGIYNLGFGDWDEVGQKVIDSSRSNNADRDKVLATVASTVIDFMLNHPNAILIARGETAAKTRLYQMGIRKNWHEIDELFEIHGLINNKWHPIESGKNYEAFAARAKQILYI